MEIYRTPERSDRTYPTRTTASVVNVATREVTTLRHQIIDGDNDLNAALSSLYAQGYAVINSSVIGNSGTVIIYVLDRPAVSATPNVPFRLPRLDAPLPRD